MSINISNSIQWLTELDEGQTKNSRIVSIEWTLTSITASYCRLWQYSKNIDFAFQFVQNFKVLAYKANITEKINKLEDQLKKWLWRGLSLEGKIMITKTFGISQLIYFLQCCTIKEADIVKVERTIFKFLWNKKWQGKCPDIIKSFIMVRGAHV